MSPDELAELKIQLGLTVSGIFGVGRIYLNDEILAKLINSGSIYSFLLVFLLLYISKSEII
jgi:hypothetical protein